MTHEDKSASNISDIVGEAIARLKDQHRLCYIDGDRILFNTGASPYEIPLAECSTYADIIGWQCHMAEKQYITTEALARFALLACDYHGLAIPR